ncbi:amidohydrolase family protein [Curtanaerobium respiraculi]|uniref:amidohydrolase family protein n=1 Tax=Curtanaerobium respiraculi TaxID=2949669 RepID=UPI0024B345A7|nr:amidohydrolase family protein [Curtanaerobium respiraculi]
MLLCAEYVLPITSDPIENGAVLVRNGKIADIGSAHQLKARYPHEEVRENDQAAIMPGLVDVHSHVEFSVLRGMVTDLPYAQWLEKVMHMSSTLDAATMYDSALVGGLEMLSSGITCLGSTTQSESTVRAISDLGLRATIYREVGAMDARRVDFAMHQAAEDIEKWQGEVDSRRMRIGIASAPLYDCHPAIYSRVAKFAGDGLPVALHIAGSREEYDFIKFGRSTFSVDRMKRRGYVEVPPWLPTGATPVNYALNWGAFEAKNVMAIHAVHVKDDDIQVLRQYDVAIAYCPRCNGLLGMGVAPLSEYLKAGMRIGIGTDSPAATDTTDVFAEMRTGMQLQRATDPKHFLTSDTMLEMATMGGARVLGLEDSIGSLEVGKAADIIAIDLSGSHATPTKDPVAAAVNTASASDVVMTMIDGEIVYDKGVWNVDVAFAQGLACIVKARSRLRSLNVDE